MKKVQMAPGIFKGMKVIVIFEERLEFGDQVRDPGRILLPPDRMDCCIRQTLYSQPDFQVMTSLLEEHWEVRFRFVVPPRVPPGA